MANKFGLTLDLERKNPALLHINVDLYESIVELQTKENEYQFAVKVTLENRAFNDRLNGAQPELPIVVSNVVGYSFRDTIESNNSIYADMFSSPKQRGLELMREPYTFRLEQAINDSLDFYVNKWYNGVLPTQLLNVHLTVRDTIRDTSLEQGGRKFVPLNKFKSLK